MALSLLGPPEINIPTSSQQPSSVAATVSDPFMSLMVSNFNSTKATAPPPPLQETEHNSATYAETGNACLNLFYHVVRDPPYDDLGQRLWAAWKHDPLTALKVICNLRGVRGTGKSDKEGFLKAAVWLHEHHPKTLACNIASVTEFGCFKDLPELLYRLIEGTDVRERQKSEWLRRKGRKGRGFKNQKSSNTKLKKKSKKLRSVVPKELRIQRSLEKDRAEKEKAKKLREEKKMSMAQKLLEKYRHDADFRFLYERVSDHFAECLKADLQFLNSGETRKISFAAKWCPSLDSSYDRSTLLCESIARKIFPKESHPEYKDTEDAHYAYRVRDRLRKEVLSPLRKALELPEVYIGAKKWNSIPYHRVPSVAMKVYKEKFMVHDGKRFIQYLYCLNGKSKKTDEPQEGKHPSSGPKETKSSHTDLPISSQEYLKKVNSGKPAIAFGALLPHEIIESLDDNDGGGVAEIQWKRMVDDLLKKGKMKSSLAICYVHGGLSKVGTDVSVAMGVLVSELSDEPWKGKLITFNEKPKLQTVEGHDLRSKMGFVRSLEWGRKPDLQMVFDLILQVAVQGRLKEDQMIKRVFVFSDAQFVQASQNEWETDYMVITKKFADKGYGSAVPQIVFWNLRETKATPAFATENGVAMVSGYSKNLMKLFLDRDGDINPEALLKAAISGEEYQKLVLVD